MFNESVKILRKSNNIHKIFHVIKIVLVSLFIFWVIKFDLHCLDFLHFFLVLLFDFFPIIYAVCQKNYPLNFCLPVFYCQFIFTILYFIIQRLIKPFVVYLNFLVPQLLFFDFHSFNFPNFFKLLFLHYIYHILAF